LVSDWTSHTNLQLMYTGYSFAILNNVMPRQIAISNISIVDLD